MITDPTQPSQANGQQLPSMADQGKLLGLCWLNDYQQRLAIQRQTYADVCGQPVPSGSGAGISLTTVNQPPAQPQPAAPAPASNGSSLLKTVAVAAGMATGGAGLLGGGLVLGNLFSKPPVIQPPAPIIQQPVAPPGQVTFGINQDGTLTP